MTPTPTPAPDEMAFKELCRAIDPNYHIYNIDPRVNKIAAERDFADRAEKAEQIAKRIMALRSRTTPPVSGAPQCKHDFWGSPYTATITCSKCGWSASTVTRS